MPKVQFTVALGMVMRNGLRGLNLPSIDLLAGDELALMMVILLLLLHPLRGVPLRECVSTGGVPMVAWAFFTAGERKAEGELLCRDLTVATAAATWWWL